MNRYDHVLALVRQRPWAVTPEVMATIAEVMALRMGGQPLSDDEIRERVTAQRTGARDGGRRDGGVAIVPLYGLLVPKAGLMADLSGATSMEAFSRDLRAAVADPDVGTIVLDVDSPGGSVELIPETAALVRQAREQKPIVAVANTLMASAAYFLAAQASEVVSTPSGLVGSIGTLFVHEDLSGFYEQRGVKHTIIKAGKFKAEANPYGPLSDEDRAHLQEEVDAFQVMFIANVAKGRGVSKATVRDGYGEGRVLTAAAAKEAGLIDRIASLDETVARVLKSPPRAGARALAGTFVGLESETFGPGETGEVIIETDAPEDMGDARFEFEREKYQRTAPR